MEYIFEQIKAPMVLTGNIGCIFGEDELRTSLFYKEPKQLTPLVSFKISSIQTFYGVIIVGSKFKMGPIIFN